jgi:hypothetical protein
MNDQIVIWETMSCLTVPYKLARWEYYTIEMYRTVVCTFKSNLHVT